MKLPVAKVLPFEPAAAGGERPRVGRVHQDGSITFRDRTYASIKEVPQDCLAIRPDRETHRQFTRLYQAIAPEPRRWRRRRAFAPTEVDD